MTYIEVARMNTELMIRQIDEMRIDDPDNLPESSADIASVIQRHAMHEHYELAQWQNEPQAAPQNTPAEQWQYTAYEFPPSWKRGSMQPALMKCAAS